MTYKLIGTWPARVDAYDSTHESGSLDDLRHLAASWSRAGAECVIVRGTDVVERFDLGIALYVREGE